MKLLLAPFLMLCSRFNHPCQHTQSRSLCQKFPAILVFGDSMVDSGNNHYVTTVFRANHLTYGREFPGQVPTGRFSNGTLIPGLVASVLEIKESAPPLLDPNV